MKPVPRAVTVAVAAIAALCLPQTFVTQAHADGRSTRLSLSMDMPRICHLSQIDATAHAATLREVCSTPGVFTVIARHDPALGGRAIFTYGGRRTIASKTGETRIYAAFGASNARRLFEVQGAKGAEVDKVTLEIRPAP